MEIDNSAETARLDRQYTSSGLWPLLSDISDNGTHDDHHSDAVEHTIRQRWFIRYHHAWPGVGVRFVSSLGRQSDIVTHEYASDRR